MQDDQNYNFYDQGESMIEMAAEHYKGSLSIATQYSSWSASLVTVLCSCEWRLKQHGEEGDVHLSVIDTHALGKNVLIWHCPHLYVGGGNHEFLAHGRIEGHGYKAISYLDIKAEGLMKIFPKPVGGEVDALGGITRQKLFKQVATSVSDDFLSICNNIASHFGHLRFPVAAALICTHPRPWQKRLPMVADFTDREGEVVLKGLDKKLADELALERWLMEDGKVDTRWIPEVQQWIDLLRSIMNHSKIGAEAT